MSTTLERGEMAKKAGRPKRSERNDMTVKIDRTIGGKAKAIATHRGIPIAEFLSEVLASPVDKAYAQMLRELEGSK